jgi:hypothetical protein
MRDKLLVTMSIMINERLEEIHMDYFDGNLADLDDPVINRLLELRKIIFSEKTEMKNCLINFID